MYDYVINVGDNISKYYTGLDAIAARLEVGKNTVTRWQQDLGLPLFRLHVGAGLVPYTWRISEHAIRHWELTVAEIDRAYESVLRQVIPDYKQRWKWTKLRGRAYYARAMSLYNERMRELGGKIRATSQPNPGANPLVPSNLVPPNLVPESVPPLSHLVPDSFSPSQLPEIIEE